MSAIVIPDVPDLDSWSGGAALIFKPNVVALVSNLRQTSEQYATLREADDRAKGELENSDHPAAVEYRQIMADVTAKVSKIDEELQAEIKAAKDRAKERKAKATEISDAARKSALETVTGVVLADVNASDVVKNYKETVDLLKTTGAALKDSFPQLSEWVKTLPSPVKQAKGENGKAGAPRGTTPRLAYADIDGNVLDKPTFTLIGQTLKIKTDARNFLTTRLLGEIGTWDNFSTTNNTTFTVTTGDTEHKITVRRAVPAADKVETATAE